jgi:hypothetical protein
MHLVALVTVLSLVAGCAAATQAQPSPEQTALLYLDGADWQISEKDAADLQRIAWETVQDYQAGH